MAMVDLMGANGTDLDEVGILLGAVDDLDPDEVIALSGLDLEENAPAELLGTAELLGAKGRRKLKAIATRIKARAKKVRAKMKRDPKFRRKVIAGGIAKTLFPFARGRKARRKGAAVFGRLGAKGKRKALRATGMFATGALLPPGGRLVRGAAMAIKRLKKRIAARKAAKRAGVSLPAPISAPVAPGLEAPPMDRPDAPGMDKAADMEPGEGAAEGAQAESAEPEPQDEGDQGGQDQDEGGQDEGGQDQDEGTNGEAADLPAKRNQGGAADLLRRYWWIGAAGLGVYLLTQKKRAA